MIADHIPPFPPFVDSSLPYWTRGSALSTEPGTYFFVKDPRFFSKQPAAMAGLHCLETVNIAILNMFSKGYEIVLWATGKVAMVIQSFPRL